MKDIRYIIILLVNVCIATFVAKADDDVAAMLRSKLNSTTEPEERYEIFRQIHELSYDKDNEISPLIEYLNDARKTENTNEELKAVSNICRNYYTRDMPDSLALWTKYIDSRKAGNAYYYFLVKCYSINLNIKHKNFRLAQNEIANIQKEIKLSHSEMGNMVMLATLGNLYKATKKTDKAISALKQALSISKRKHEYDGVRMMVYTSLVNTFIDAKNYDAALAIALELNNMVKSMSDVKSAKTMKHQWDSNKLLLSCYVKMGNKNSAYECMQILQRISTDYNADDDVEYFFLQAQYNRLINQYESALTEVNNLLKDYDGKNPDYMLFKAGLLKDMGRSMEAFNAYIEAYKTIGNEPMDNMMREMMQIYDGVDKQKKEEDAQKSLVKQAKDINEILVVVLGFSSAVLLVMLVLYLRKIRLQKQLAKSNKALDREQAALQKVNEDLEVALNDVIEENRKRNEFMNNMSHEIRTPLNSIVGFSQLISDDNKEIDPSEKKYAEIIKTNSDLMLKLVNDVLDLSQLDSTIMDVDIQPVDIVAVANNTLKTINSLVKPGVKVTFNTYCDSVVIDSDRFRLQQLLTNILGNAAKFTLKGEINLTIKKFSNCVEFIVTDTGCGISDEDKARIFERYEKLNEKSMGTGLGLYISNLISKKLGGRLYIDETYNNGARFVFDHPIRLRFGQDLGVPVDKNASTR